MEDFIRDLFEKLWKKWASVPVLGLFFMLSLAFLVPENWDISDHNALVFYVSSLVASILFIWNIFVCYKENVLPRAKALSVLFIIDAESPQLFQEIKHKLVTNFGDCFDLNEEYAFSSICISVDQISKYNLQKKDDVLSLLEKTKCAFFVRVRYHVDNVSNAENYEMAINYGIVHPEYRDSAEKLLETEMNLLATPIKKRKFKRNNCIENLDFTAQALSVICQYLLSLVRFLSGDLDVSYKILKSLYTKSLNGNEAISQLNLSSLVKRRLFEVCIAYTNRYYDSFYFEKSDETLIKMIEKLEEANALFPNTYDYFNGKAYCLVALYLDTNTAQKYVDECKKQDIIQTWKYSEAFLAAYNHHSPNTIIRKYKEAFKVKHDLARIADYIEYIIDKKPDHKDLHLAAALVYDRLNDHILASEHFMEYSRTDAGKKIHDFIDKKLSLYANSLIE